MYIKSKIHPVMALGLGPWSESWPVPADEIFGKHYVGETGTQIIVDCGQNISAATGCLLYVRKPDGTLVTWTPTILTLNSLPNYLSYSTLAGDFDQIGSYCLQSYMMLAGWSGRGETVMFQILGNFDAGY